MEAAIALRCAIIGVGELKEKQNDAITCFVEDNDILVILLRGSGSP